MFLLDSKTIRSLCVSEERIVKIVEELRQLVDISEEICHLLVEKVIYEVRQNTSREPKDRQPPIALTAPLEGREV